VQRAALDAGCAVQSLSAMLLPDHLDRFLIARRDDGRVHLITADIDNAAHPVIEFASHRSGRSLGLDDTVRALRGGFIRCQEQGGGHDRSENKSLHSGFHCPAFLNEV